MLPVRYRDALRAMRERDKALSEYAKAHDKGPLRKAAEKVARTSAKATDAYEREISERPEIRDEVREVVEELSRPPTKLRETRGA